MHSRCRDTPIQVGIGTALALARTSGRFAWTLARRKLFVTLEIPSKGTGIAGACRLWRSADLLLYGALCTIGRQIASLGVELDQFAAAQHTAP